MVWQMLGVLAVLVAAWWYALEAAVRVAGWLWRRSHRPVVAGIG
jgi:hypothetical protein